MQEEFNCYEVQDPFIQELIIHLDGFMNGFKETLTPNNYQSLIATLTTQVAQQFEKVILKTNFSRVSIKNSIKIQVFILTFKMICFLLLQFSWALCSSIKKSVLWWRT